MKKDHYCNTNTHMSVHITVLNLISHLRYHLCLTCLKGAVCVCVRMRVCTHWIGMLTQMSWVKGKKEWLLFLCEILTQLFHWRLVDKGRDRATAGQKGLQLRKWRERQSRQPGPEVVLGEKVLSGQPELWLSWLQLSFPGDFTRAGHIRVPGGPGSFSQNNT